MSDVKVLRAKDYPRMPWKNGGGSTEEITRDAGAGLDGFGWRLSIADIAESGGFSSFAGYQRVITVLQGDGMTLCVDGDDTRSLLPLDPFAFSGESQVSCTLARRADSRFQSDLRTTALQRTFAVAGGRSGFSLQRARCWCSASVNCWK
jgi:environmental stress-induced protein Ves